MVLRNEKFVIWKLYREVRSWPPLSIDIISSSRKKRFCSPLCLWSQAHQDISDQCNSQNLEYWLTIRNRCIYMWSWTEAHYAQSVHEPRSKLMVEWVRTKYQRGRESGSCLFWGDLEKSRHIVPITLLLRVQFFRKDMYKAVGEPGAISIVLSVITGSYFRRRKRLTIF